MASTVLISQIADKTPGTSWTITNNPTSGGNAYLAAGVGSTGDKVLYLRGLSAGIPLDADIQGITVSMSIAPSGGATFSSTDYLLVNIGQITNFINPANTGVEKTQSLDGLGSTTVTFGGSTDEWGKAFWTRFQFVYGLDQFGISIRKTGATRGITVSNVVITVHYALQTTLTGSRAPVPKDPLSSQIETIYPEKVNGVDDRSIIKSADINALGDALYNLQRSVVDQVDDPDTVQVFGGLAGESLLLTSIYVSGTVTNFSDDLTFDEIRVNNVSTVNVNGLSNIVRSNFPAIPAGKSINYEFAEGHCWTTNSSGSTLPLKLTVGGFAISNTTNIQNHRLTFRVSSPNNLALISGNMVNGYGGIYVPQDGAVSEYGLYSELIVRPDNVEGSPNIPGLTVTYNNGNSSDPSGAQGFKVKAEDAYNSSGQLVKKRFIQAQTLDENVTSALGKGVKFTDRTNSKFDAVDFGLYQGALSNRPLLDAWDFTRTGIFLAASGSGANLNGYGVMFTRGPDNGLNPTAWLVKFTNWNSSTPVAFPNYSSANGYQTFPWPGGNTQIQALSSYAVVVPSLADLTDAKNFRFTVVVSGSTAILTLEQYSFNTVTWSTVLTATDSSSPYLSSGKSGLFMVEPVLPKPRANVMAGRILLEGLTFSYKTAYTQTPVTFQGRIIGMGKLK